MNINSDFGSIITKCRKLLLELSNVFVCFIRRQMNYVAHSLAKVENFFASAYYFDVMPDCIVAHIYCQII